VKLDPQTGHLPNRGRIFTPFWTEEVFVKPSSQGGASWPPSSYDPRSRLLYVCAADKISSYKVSLPLAPPEPNKSYFGGSMGNASTPPLGIFAALDVTTNKIVWRQQWKEPCYSGSVTTASGLVFVGRSDGRLTALDGKDGSKLWEFMTDGGVNTTVTTFEHKGQQLVAVHAGGSTFGNGKRGDGVWLFALDGTIATLAPPPPPRRGPPQAAAAPAGPADLANGERLYRQACVACHGDDGKGGLGGGKSLLAGQSRERILAITSNGANTMPAFAGTYDAAQLRDIAAYVVEKLQAR
jgi:quinohemoprotein ethanol dehydrogenase